MADDADEDADEGPAVELGDGPDVEGAPVVRIASRLHFGIERSEVIRREGDETVRTPDGPRELSAVLEESEETYFPTKQAFLTAVRAVTGVGPVPTE